MDLLPPDSAPRILQTTASGLERIHVAHALGSGAKEFQPCPRSEGRIDLLVQGTGHSRNLDELTGKAAWLSLSSRFLPSSEEKRPIWLQPYTPRLDRELWRLAQRLKVKKSGSDVEVPKWALRLISRLSSREGAGARLSAGEWQGLGAMVHGPSNGGQYGKLPTPLPVLYLMRTAHKPVEDIHSNKWWKRQEAKIVRLLEEDELRKLSKKFAPKCQPLPWAELPVAEAIGGLLIAAFVGRIFSPPDKKKKKR